jgi:hypothetical protein
MLLRLVFTAGAMPRKVSSAAFPVNASPWTVAKGTPHGVAEPDLEPEAAGAGAEEERAALALGPNLPRVVPAANGLRLSYRAAWMKP